MPLKWHKFCGNLTSYRRTPSSRLGQRGPMKRLLLASAVVGLVATMGTANATPVTTLNTLTIWNALTPGSTVTSANQQALPAINPLFTGAVRWCRWFGQVPGRIS